MAGGGETPDNKRQKTEAVANGAPSHASHSVVLILDYGSQYTQLITRRVRELQILSLSIAGDASLDRIKAENPSVIILSGGPNSVHEEGAPGVPPGFWEYAKSNKIPVLGICYGMQLIVQSLGGCVKQADAREYGRMPMTAEPDSVLFGPVLGKRQNVWMSHGDEAIQLPEGFRVIAKSEQGSIVGIENVEHSIYGLQYHPEVTHTDLGLETLRRFLLELSKVKADWKMECVIEEQIKAIRAQMGATKHAICALSGGVDSTVAAVLVHKAVGDRLHCLFVDNGLMRFDERNRVMATFKEQLHLPVKAVDASQRFLSKLAGVTDPERKRKIIGAEFIAVFQDYAEEVSAAIGHVPEFLVQGTLYPDVIESCPPPGSGKKHSHTIKSHHNVGGLPENLKFSLVEPMRELFKDEVRKMGELLSVPRDFLRRHPFPGPGLAVRVLGDVTAEGVLDTLRQVDEIFINCIKEEGLYDEIWQAFAVFLPIKSVGVQGDKRTHSHVMGLRAITSADGMTADWYHFKPEVLARISSKICNMVPSVNRIVYDITSKPPATVEWE
eukprot:jgi/Mesvir1/1980/Mv03483-RA.1